MSDKLTRRAALALIGSGALVAATETSGYTSVTAERGTTVSATDDASGLLALEHYDDQNTPTAFTNNTGVELNVTLETDGNDDVEFNADGSGWEGTSVSFILTDGETVNVDARGSVDTKMVDVTATATSGGTGLDSIELTREFDIGQSGFVREIVGSVKSPGGSGKYSFDLENTGDVNVTIYGIAVRQTTKGSAIAVERKKGAVSVNNIDVFDGRINISCNDNRKDFSSSQNLSSGNTDTYELRDFIDGNDKKVSMNGEDLQIKLYLNEPNDAEDSVIIDLCSNGSDSCFSGCS